MKDNRKLNRLCLLKTALTELRDGTSRVRSKRTGAGSALKLRINELRRDQPKHDETGALVSLH